MDNKSLKKFEIIKYLVNFGYVIGMYFIGINIALIFDNGIGLEGGKNLFFLYLLLIFTLILVYFFSVLFHEVGHLLFGIRGKMIFESFNVYKITVVSENGKIVFKKGLSVPGVLGYCRMSFCDKVKYKKLDVILYYMGGVIVNFILAIIFVLFLLFINNPIVKIFSLVFSYFNLFLVVNNMIPSVLKAGSNSDMLSILHYLDDPKYIDCLIKVFKIQKLISDGVELKNVDSKLFYKPESVLKYSDKLMAMYYVDYMISKDRYNDIIGYVENILKDDRDVLSKADINILKSQLILAIFSVDENIENYKEYWNKDFVKYINLMKNLVPEFLAINYLYLLKVKKSEVEANKLLDEFEQMKCFNTNKEYIEAAQKALNEVVK